MTQLTIWKAEEDTQDHAGLIEGIGRLHAIPVQIDGQLLGVLYVQRQRPKTPPWVSYFSKVEEVGDTRLSNQSAAAAFVVVRPTGTFALTFGYGQRLLKDGVFDQRFGLRATLNAIDPASIRAIDHKRLESIERLTREQLSRKAGLEQFGLDVERDLLRAVTGTPRDPALGRRLAGAAQLAVSGDVPLEKLGRQLDSYADIATRDTYREHFSWVDNLGEVKDPVYRAELDAVLERKIRAEDLARVHMVPPEVIDWASNGGFRYVRRGRTYEELLLGDYFAERGSPRDTTIAGLKNDSVFVVSAATAEIVNTWHAYRCISAEIEHRSAVFVLSESRWYRVEPTFLASIDAVVDNLQPTAVRLPAYQDRDEGSYNARAARQSNGELAYMDRQLLQYGSRGRVELCDLFSRTRALIHVKRYGPSSTLGHLFAQGTVAAQLLAAEPGFRTLVCERLPASHRWPAPLSPLETTQFEIAFAVVSPAGRPLVLPFFSRVTLRNAVKTLRALNFRVTLTQIPG